EPAGMHHGLAAILFWVGPVIRDVLVARPVAAFAGHAQHDVLPVILPAGSGDVVHVGVVALQAAGRGFAGEVAGAVAVDGDVGPAIQRIEPDRGHLVEPVVVPGEVHLIARSGRAVDQPDPRLGPLLPAGRLVDGGL